MTARSRETDPMGPGQDVGGRQEVRRADPEEERPEHPGVVSTVRREPERRSFSARKATTVCSHAGTSSRVARGAAADASTRPGRDASPVAAAGRDR